jgi:hypothetical protein
MGCVKDITGQRFGRLVVIRRVGLDRQGLALWECRCDCGAIPQVLGSNLRKGDTKSCGCLQREIVGKLRAKDITGQRFGRLVALYPTGESHNNKVMWRLRCDCGIEIEHPNSDLGNRINSCGCLRREKATQRLVEKNYRHGDRSDALILECFDKSTGRIT